MTHVPYPFPKVYALLEPGPVVLVTTSDGQKSNVMTLSWHTMMEFEPPRVGCVLSSRNYSFELLCASQECAINIPTVELAEKVVACGNTSGRALNKLTTFELTTFAASLIKAPLIADCFANLECRVADTRLVQDYNFFILEVVAAWIDPAVEHPQTLHHNGYGTFTVDGRVITLPSGMR